METLLLVWKILVSITVGLVLWTFTVLLAILIWRTIQYLVAVTRLAELEIEEYEVDPGGGGQEQSIDEDDGKVIEL